MYKILLFFALPLQLLALDLKQEVKKARAGDFIVYAYKQTFSLVRVAQSTDKLLVAEEISAPLSAKPSNWQEWIAHGAPKHNSWTISRIDLEHGKVESIFSVDEKKYLTNNPDFQFLPTLFQLSLKSIDPVSRKYVGAEPLPGERDMRHLWLPKIIFEGHEIHPPIEAMRSRWPNDRSELSDKIIDFYFPQNEALTYLPYWIELPGGIIKAKILALDSGTNLVSPVKLETYEQVEHRNLAQQILSDPRAQKYVNS